MRKTLNEERERILNIMEELNDSDSNKGMFPATILRSSINDFIDSTPHDDFSKIRNSIIRIVEECIYERKISQPDNYFNPIKPKHYE